MKLKMKGWRVAALCASAALVAMLASCGGGSEPQTFFASRLLAFGDESSVINPDQSKYTINALIAGSSTVYDCTSNPIWIQSLASIYGLFFPQCPDVSGIAPASRIYATAGATVADLSTQIDNALNDSSITSADMVTVLVGTNDIVAQFNQYPNVGEDVLLDNLDAAGTALAAQVNRLAAMGARVIVSTVPNIGLTPFAGDRSVGSTNPNPTLLRELNIELPLLLLVFCFGAVMREGNAENSLTAFFKAGRIGMYAILVGSLLVLFFRRKL